MKNKRVRSTQETLIAMKKQLFEKCLRKELKWKQVALVLQMHSKAVSRLKRRYLAEGESAFYPKKPGPKSYKPPANKTDELIADLVSDLGINHSNEGPQVLADRLEREQGLKLDQSTVFRILKRRKIRYGHDYKRWKADPKLYCLETVGEELQMDACYPYGKARKICSFDAIDDCSRYIDGKCYDRETCDNAIEFMDRMIPRLPFRVLRIRVDNRYGHKFKEHCLKQYGIEVIANDPYSPEQNGKIERFHKTLKREFFYRYCSFTDSLETIHYKYSLWLSYYNFKRRHRGLGMNGLTPAQKITQTLLQSTANELIINPQKVTGTLQSYNS
jgi:transposase InsO family protein